MAVSPFIYYLRMVAFMGTLALTSLGIVLLQLPALPLRYTNHAWYRQYIRLTEQVWGSVMCIMTYLFTPVELVLTGDHQWLAGRQRFVLISNHQTYLDWWYLWSLARLKGAHGDVKILLMDYLKYLPIFGWGMWGFEFIFMKRKWALDMLNMRKHLQRAKWDLQPLWLIIFPEGTLNTPNNKETSRAYAKKMDLTEDPTHVLLPKSTGLQFCLSALRPEVHTLVDITMGYSGLTADQVPYYEYLFNDVIFGGKRIKQIHLHVRRFDVDQLPGFNNSTPKANKNFEDLDQASKDMFNVWLRNNFMEKDVLMESFYKFGHFVPDMLPRSHFPFPNASGNGNGNGRSVSPSSPNGDGENGSGRDECLSPTLAKDHRQVIKIVPEVQDWFSVLFTMYSLYYWTGPLAIAGLRGALGLVF
ncbi:hypothetical protein HK102_007142 [Quaeritorhiza haematococci]|nr:hypothetical protein HK102_007142 [Quaeritorhiza haematococci]